MTQTIGSIIRSNRENLKLTRPELAKRLHISAGYLGFLERDYPVRFSAKLQGKVIKTLKLSKTEKGKLIKGTEPHNKKALALARKYRRYVALKAKPK